MKTSVIEVHDMLSVWSLDEVEKRIGEVPGVESVTLNYAAGSATVRYDETRLEIADIKSAMRQSEYQSAGESEAKHESEQNSARKRAAVPTPEAAPASASTPVATIPKASTIAPAVSSHEDHAAPGAQPSKPVAAVPKAAPVAPAAKPAPVAPAGEAAPDAKPSTPVAAAPKAGPVVPATVPAPAAKSSTPPTAEPKADFWKVHAFSLATTLGVAYMSCAIFDVLFPPFGLLAAVAPASPWPISGSPLAFLTGFALFTVAGFVLGALYGIASEFWSKRLR
ncbi:MAG: cation transporter [Gemmatimonadaceae bacterium]